MHSQHIQAPFFCGAGDESQGLAMLGKGSTVELHPQPPNHFYHLISKPRKWRMASQRTFYYMCGKDSVYTYLFSLAERAYSQPQNNYFCVMLVPGFIWLFVSFRPRENANIINIFQSELTPRMCFIRRTMVPSCTCDERGKKTFAVHPINLNGMFFKQGPERHLTPLPQILH